MRWCRYILVHLGTRAIDATAPTIHEIWSKVKRQRESHGAFYRYWVGAHEIVDLWEEPGRIVYTLQNPPRLPQWEAGTSFPDEDHTTIRFQQMELE